MDISEVRMEKAIKDYLEEADADTIAYIAGCMFGGECTVYFKKNPYDGKRDLTYNFRANENYADEFSDIGEY